VIFHVSTLLPFTPNNRQQVIWKLIINHISNVNNCAIKIMIGLWELELSAVVIVIEEISV